MTHHDNLTNQRTRKRRKGGAIPDAERKAAKETFLAEFRISANVTIAACKANISRQTVYTWLEQDEAFSLRYRQAEAESTERLEAEAWRRAVEGVEEPIVSSGKLVYGEDGQPLTVRKYSDTVLLALLKARKPERYKDRVDVTTKDQSLNSAYEMMQSLYHARAQRGSTLYDLAGENDLTPND
jgi:hypothetical protein